MTAQATADAFLAARLDEYIAETARLCAHPSISAHGRGLPECAAAVAAVLERRGFAVQQVATGGAPVVVGRQPGVSDRTLLFYNHYDVQPVDPLDLWTSPPFEPGVRRRPLRAGRQG